MCGYVGMCECCEGVSKCMNVSAWWDSWWVQGIASEWMWRG